MASGSGASPSAWKPSLGAFIAGDGVTFRVWAPDANQVDLRLESPGAPVGAVRLVRTSEGFHEITLPGVGPGTRYRYLVDGQGPFPDPASRFQPEGVHGPSEVIDPRSFPWTDEGWRGVALDDLVLYELHVGTFTPEGTFAAARERLPWLKELGVTAIEIMPVADFPGERNWGYDGVSPFAPARCYGRPDDLRRLVDDAHRIGLAVHLDVVYNHLGPDGNYLGVYSTHYFSKRHHTTWGWAINCDGPHAREARDYLIENAQHWIHEYHLDGLRLDATHGILDESPRHLLAELAARVRASVPDRQVLIIAEDHRNLAHFLKPESAGGWGLDAVWADDFHHQMRRLLAGDDEGYYRDYAGTAEDLAATLRQGWFYVGQRSIHLGEPRGTDPAGLPPRCFVICLQNHDQVGNRALGERLHHQIDLAAYRAASALLLCAPQTPLLFMGQEWAARTPFLYFTDHHEELGRQVTKGRRQEFKAFSAFTAPEKRALIPDPQALATFLASKLDWSETDRDPGAAVVRLYRDLLALRRSEPALRGGDGNHFTVRAAGPDAIVLERFATDGSALCLAVQLRGSGVVRLPAPSNPNNSWAIVLTTEEKKYGGDPACVSIEQGSIQFHRPAALIGVSSIFH